MPIVDRFGHTALSITAEVAGPITRTALQGLAGDLRAAAARVSAGISGITGISGMAPPAG